MGKVAESTRQHVFETASSTIDNEFRHLPDAKHGRPVPRGGATR